MIRAIDVAWAAGVLEGECHFAAVNGKPRIRLEMTDWDVVRRVHSIFKLGTLAQRAIPSGKLAFRWNVDGQYDAAAIMMTILPLMGVRRSAKISDILTMWKSMPTKKLLFTCRYGHQILSEDDIASTTDKRRRCRAYVNLRAKKYRSKLKDTVYS